MQYKNLTELKVDITTDEIQSIVDASVISDNFKTKELTNEYGFIDTLMHGVTLYNQKECCVKDIPKCYGLYSKIKEVQKAEAYDLLFSFSKKDDIITGSVVVEEICPNIKYVKSYGESDDLFLSNNVLFDDCYDCANSGLIL